MAHNIFGRHLGRNTKTRYQLFRSLAVNVIEKGKVVTTISKAKAVQPFLERLVTKAKVNKIGIQRLALAELGNNQKAWYVLVNKIAAVFKDTLGGYTKIIKIGTRPGDNATKALLTWSKEIDKEEVKEVKENVTEAEKKAIVKKEKAKSK